MSIQCLWNIGKVTLKCLLYYHCFFTISLSSLWKFSSPQISLQYSHRLGSVSLQCSWNIFERKALGYKFVTLSKYQTLMRAYKIGELLFLCCLFIICWIMSFKFWYIFRIRITRRWIIVLLHCGKWNAL